VLCLVEVLSFEMRAKGMAFSSLAVNAGGLLNQFAWPVSLKNIGWKTYIIFIAWCTAQTVIIYVWFPETKNRTVSFQIFSVVPLLINFHSLRNSTISSNPPTQSRSRWRRSRSWLVSNTVLLSSRRLWCRQYIGTTLVEDHGGWTPDERHTDVDISNTDSCSLMTQ
jgi:hypothetical protein